MPCMLHVTQEHLVRTCRFYSFLRCCSLRSHICIGFHARKTRSQSKLIQTNPSNTPCFKLTQIVWHPERFFFFEDPTDMSKVYPSPIYKTSERKAGEFSPSGHQSEFGRQGVLSTTGHSTNFVCTIKIPIVQPQDAPSSVLISPNSIEFNRS